MSILSTLNSKKELDFLQNSLEILNQNDGFDNPYLNININSKFYDSQTLLEIPNIQKSPVYISFNAQSINSKYESIKELILELTNIPINVEIVAIQET